MSPSSRIVLACSIGAATGMLVALWISGFWWWLGAGVGMATAGTAYAFPQVRNNVGPALRIALSSLVYLPRVITVLGRAGAAILKLPYSIPR